MTPEQIEDLIQKLEGVGGQVYEAALRQSYVGGLTAVALAVLCLAAVIAGGLLVRSGVKAYRERGGGYADEGEGRIIAGLVTLVLGVFGLGFASTFAVTNLVNPEWAAIERILSAAAGGS
ncbi:MAG: RNA polymerase sigma factor region1.1 domain-containing protein [Actinomycetota bacterium]|nr:RNA polymerase sigma factor region1.1 domain-containing protein [Actinomycetota bacterium]